MADSFRTVRKNTILIAEDIPADKYNFKAADDTMTVAAILAHIAVGTGWTHAVHGGDRMHAVTGEDFGRLMGEMGRLGATLTSRDALLEALKSHGDKYAALLEGMTDAQLAEMVALPGAEKSRFEMLLGIKEHEMHHRAQLMLMQRLLGIVPHLTRARQQRQ